VLATRVNGFADTDIELALNGPVQVQHIAAMGESAAENASAAFF